MSKCFEVFEDGKENPRRRVFHLLEDPTVMTIQAAIRQPGVPQIGSMYKAYPDLLCYEVAVCSLEDTTHFEIVARYKESIYVGTISTTPTES
jgi:hypothetical protein